MKKRILTVAFAAAFLFSGALLFQVESADAQDYASADAVATESRLGKWIKIYGGGQDPAYEECIAHYTAECRTGDTRKVQAADAVAVPN